MAITISPISLAPNNSQFFASKTVENANWKFSPPESILYWVIGNGNPNPFDQAVEFPSFPEIENFTNYTNWEIQSELSFLGSIPFLLVNMHGNNLGVGFENGGNFYRKTVTFQFQSLALLSVGSYFCRPKFSVSAVNPETQLREIISESEMQISFVVLASIYTSPIHMVYQGRTLLANGNYSPMVFNYFQGGPLPNFQDIFIFGEMDSYYFATTGPYMTANFFDEHSLYKKYRLGFNNTIANLAPGEHNFVFKIDGPRPIQSTHAEVNVKLVVLAAAPTNFSITPGEIVIDVIRGGAVANQEIASLGAVGDWSVVGQVPEWLQISQYSGSGNDTLLFSAINYDHLATGTYSGEILLQNGNNQIVLPVTLNVSSFMQSPFAAGQLHFTQELDYLTFTSSTPETYIDFTIDIKIYKNNSDQFILYNRKYDLPLFQGTGEFHIGSIVDTLFEEIESLTDFVPDFENNYHTTQTRPAEVSVSFEEKYYTFSILNDDAVLVSSDLPMFKMIKGHKPFVTSSQMALLSVAQQEQTRITPDSIIAISFTHLNSPRLLVKKNGVILEDLTIVPFSGVAPKNIFSYFRFANDFSPGDSVEICIINEKETRTQRYLVFPAGMESTYFFFENDNHVLESFEFSGRRRINSKYTHTVNKKFKDLYQVESKVFSKNLQSIMVNTGNLLKADHRIIDAIIKSKRVWCSLDNPSGPYFLVDAVSTKLDPQDTSVSEESFDVEFNILENADAIIYPR